MIKAGRDKRPAEKVATHQLQRMVNRVTQRLRSLNTPSAKTIEQREKYQTGCFLTWNNAETRPKVERKTQKLEVTKEEVMESLDRGEENDELQSMIAAGWSYIEGVEGGESYPGLSVKTKWEGLISPTHVTPNLTLTSLPLSPLLLHTVYPSCPSLYPPSVVRPRKCFKRKRKKIWKSL